MNCAQLVRVSECADSEGRTFRLQLPFWEGSGRRERSDNLNVRHALPPRAFEVRNPTVTLGPVHNRGAGRKGSPGYSRMHFEVCRSMHGRLVSCLLVFVSPSLHFILDS
jgi:hypothetical protein